MLQRPLRAPAHEGANGRRGGVDNVDSVFFGDGPEAPAVGKIRRAFVHHGCGSVGQRSVNDVGVARHPPDIRRAPINVVFLYVEDELVSHGGPEKEPGGGVYNAFGPPRCAARVKDIEHVLGIHGLGGTCGGGLGDEVVPQEVTPGDKWRLGGLAHALDYHNLFNRRRALQRLIRVFLQRH